MDVVHGLVETLMGGDSIKQHFDYCCMTGVLDKPEKSRNMISGSNLIHMGLSEEAIRRADESAGL